MKFVLFQSVANVVFEMNVENVFVVTSSSFTASAFEVEADVFGIQIEKVKKRECPEAAFLVECDPSMNEL
jgi:soluble P-type ATPase